MENDIRRGLDILKNISLSTTQMRDLTGSNVLMYGGLYQYKTLDDLMNNNGGMLVLMYSQSESFGHWCCLLETKINVKGRLRKCVEFYDSYSGLPDSEFAYSSPEINDKMKQDRKYLTQLMAESDWILSYNEYGFQAKDPNVSTCGWLVACRLINRNLSLIDFKKMLDRVIKSNPDILDYDDAVVVLLYPYVKLE